MAIGAAAAGEAPLAGKWRIEEVRGAGPFDASKTLFEIAADGRVGSTIGCNRIVGEPSVDGETIAFGPMTATRMACSPPLDQLETRYPRRARPRPLVADRERRAHLRR